MTAASPWRTARYHARALVRALLDMLLDAALALWDWLVEWWTRNVVADDPTEADAAAVDHYLRAIEPTMKYLRRSI